MHPRKNVNTAPRSPTPEGSPSPPSGVANVHPTSPTDLVFPQSPSLDYDHYDQENLRGVNPVALSPGGTLRMTEADFVSAVLRAVDATIDLRKNPNISSSKIPKPSDLDPSYYSEHARSFWTVIRGNPVGIFINSSQAAAAARDDTSMSIAGAPTWRGARKFYVDAFAANAIRLDFRGPLVPDTNNAGPSRRPAPFPAPSPLSIPSPGIATGPATHASSSGTKKHPITVDSAFPTPIIHYARRVVNEYPYGTRALEHPPTPTPAPRLVTPSRVPLSTIAVAAGPAPGPTLALATSAATPRVAAALSAANVAQAGSTGAAAIPTSKPAAVPRGVKRRRACKKYVVYEYDVSAEAGGHPELDEGHPLPLIFYAREPLFPSTSARSASCSPTISSISTSTLDTNYLLNLTPTDFLSSPLAPPALQTGPSRTLSAPPPRTRPLLSPFVIASAARPFESIDELDEHDELNEHPVKKAKTTPASSTLSTPSTTKRVPKSRSKKAKGKAKAKTPPPVSDFDSGDLFDSDEVLPKKDKGKAKETTSSILDDVEIAGLYDSDPVEYVPNSSTRRGRRD